MGLAWQQGPLAQHSVGHFLSPVPLPERLLYAEPLRRRMRVRFGGEWIADSERAILLHEPAHYPVAFFPREDVRDGVLEPSAKVTGHRDLGPTAWFTVTAKTSTGETSTGETSTGETSTGTTVSAATVTGRTVPGRTETGDGARAERGAWSYTDLPPWAGVLAGHVAFAWRMMDAFYEEDERIVGHAADPYHRNDIRLTSRHLVVRDGDRIVADTRRPLVLFESGFAPRWYVPREDIDPQTLAPVDGQTFCPYKGLCSYYDVGQNRRAAWSYLNAWPEVARIAGHVSFEPDLVEVALDGRRLAMEPGQAVIPHGVDRGLDTDELS
jgi:uncharacterized protein (DUF427 family)